MTRLLLIDDEERFAHTLGISLRARDFDVTTVPDGTTGLKAAADLKPDIVILDLGLPDMDGLEVLRALRAWTAVPVIVLSARHTDATKVAALDAGADDYVTKPFSINEFLARVRAALRRVTAGDAQPVIETEDFTIDLVAKLVTDPEGAVIRLTPTEWGVVEVLVRNQGKLVSQRQLLQEVWGPAYERETNYLRVYLAAVRRKLEPVPSTPRYFLTEPGMGYRFTTVHEPEP